jgi:hypothetical protein
MATLIVRAFLLTKGITKELMQRISAACETRSKVLPYEEILAAGERIRILLPSPWDRRISG